MTPALVVDGADEALEFYAAAQDQFYGDREGFMVDSFGHGWTIGSHVDDGAPDEIMRRMSKFAAAGQGCNAGSYGPPTRRRTVRKESLPK